MSGASGRAAIELTEQINTLTELNRLKVLLRQATMTGSLEEFEHIVENRE